MKERPILFSAPMVRAILEGRKTQTRRAFSDRTMKLMRAAASIGEVSWFMDEGRLGKNDLAYIRQFSPYGQPGDRLWVRETHMLGLDPDIQVGAVAYKADGYVRGGLGDFELQKWRPSIHMPRWASRILLEITAVRVERLQDISEGDAKAEGVTKTPYPDASLNGWSDGVHKELFRSLWKVINGDNSWAANPWVWVVEFKQLKGGAA